MKTHILYPLCELAFFFFSFSFSFFHSSSKKKIFKCKFWKWSYFGGFNFHSGILISGILISFIFVRLNKWRQMLKKNTKLSQNCTRKSETSKKKFQKKKLSPQCKNSPQKRNGGFNRQKSETKGEIIRLQYLLPLSSHKYTKDD